MGTVFGTRFDKVYNILLESNLAVPEQYGATAVWFCLWHRPANQKQRVMSLPGGSLVTTVDRLEKNDVVQEMFGDETELSTYEEEHTRCWNRLHSLYALCSVSCFKRCWRP